MSENVIFDNNPGQVIDSIIAPEAGVFVLVDANTGRDVLPRVAAQSRRVADATVIEVPSGDDNKNITAACQVWDALCSGGATRQSLLINIGGGMITDLGGFAASTFKRGIKYINLPTTLLSAVDASVGGKTGINFNGYKNEVGLFSRPEATLVSVEYFDTLPYIELLSGYAEMLKHALICGYKELATLINTPLQELTSDKDRFLNLIKESVEVKRAIVDRDPLESGERRALNAGHTAGHAFESYAMQQGRSLPHGFAVARGLVVELVLSKLLRGFPSDVLYEFAAYVRDNYRVDSIDCGDYDALLRIMRHDKKNRQASTVNFTLFDAPGRVVTGVEVADSDITAALDIYRDLMGI